MTWLNSPTKHDTGGKLGSKSVISSAEELGAAAPELFEKTLAHWIGMVGSDFSPANAAAFVEILNWTVQRDVRLPYFFPTTERWRELSN